MIKQNLNVDNDTAYKDRDCFSIRVPTHTETFSAGTIDVYVYENEDKMGTASAIALAGEQCRLVKENDTASMIIMAAPSACAFYNTYVQMAKISERLQAAIKKTHFFQFDDYILPFHHPASFRFLLYNNFFAEISKYYDPGKVHMFNADSPDIEKTCREYGKLIMQHGPDLQLKGTGENGHWGYHEPDIPLTGECEFIRVTLSEENIAQQMRDHPRLFPSPETVPREACTANVPLFMRTRERIEDNIPQLRKAFALLAAYGNDTVDKAVPSSMLKKHHNAVVRTTKDAAWALIDYREKGKVTAAMLDHLSETLALGTDKDVKAILHHIKSIFDRMKIEYDT